MLFHCFGRHCDKHHRALIPLDGNPCCHSGPGSPGTCTEARCGSRARSPRPASRAVHSHDRPHIDVAVEDDFLGTDVHMTQRSP